MAWIVALNKGAVFGADPSLRLQKALHELGHAYVESQGGTASVFSHYATAKLRYYAEEVFVEGFARRTLQSQLSLRTLRNSVAYENFYRNKLGLPLLPSP
jgi:hypothetical protein